MARATAFVDDLVLGRLPMTCVKTGEPAVGQLEVRTTTQVSALAWILVFFGPPGWLILLIVLARGGETFRGQVPMSDAAFQRLDRWRTVELGGLGVAAVALVGALILHQPGLLALVVLAVVGAVVGHIGHGLAGVDMRLDASRRWVTISRVHPGFAAAVRLWTSRERAT